jgi:hypothetical protein
MAFTDDFFPVNLCAETKLFLDSHGYLVLPFSVFHIDKGRGDKQKSLYFLSMNVKNVHSTQYDTPQFIYFKDIFFTVWILYILNIYHLLNHFLLDHFMKNFLTKGKIFL